MDKDKIEEGMLIAQEGMVLNKINIQTILYLLVEKGIINPEEVALKRNFIEKQPLYTNILDKISSLLEENHRAQMFTNVIENYLKQERGGS